MRPTLVLTHSIHPALERELLKNTRVLRPKTRAALLKALPHADALLTLLSYPVTKELLAHAPRLKVVGNYAVGINNIDLKACKSRRIRVINTPDVLTRATAELTLALLLAAARRIPEGEAMCRRNAFKGWAPDLLLGLELKGRDAVIVGQGRIGRETASLFRAAGLNTEFITRQDSPSQIDTKLQGAQVLSLHIPLNGDTHFWLDRARIALLPPDAIVLNTARGPVVDEKALTQALRQRKIFAAGFDVYEHEPEIPAALRKLPNVVLLPHLGSATVETREAMARALFTGVLGILNGRRPWNEVAF